MLFHYFKGCTGQRAKHLTIFWNIKHFYNGIISLLARSVRCYWDSELSLKLWEPVGRPGSWVRVSWLLEVSGPGTCSPFFSYYLKWGNICSCVKIQILDDVLFQNSLFCRIHSFYYFRWWEERGTGRGVSGDWCPVTSGQWPGPGVRSPHGQTRCRVPASVRYWHQTWAELRSADTGTQEHRNMTVSDMI